VSWLLFIFLSKSIPSQIIMEDDEEMQLNTSASGNLAFKVGFSPAVAAGTPARVPHSPINTPKRSLTEIQQKLVAAEERRCSLEAEKVEKAMKEEEKIKIANGRREELENLVKMAAEVALTKKLETTKENRDRVMEERIQKMKEHEKKVEEVRKVKVEKMEEVAEKAETELEQKHARAEDLRNQHMEALMERLKKQDEHVAAVKSVMEQKLHEDEELWKRRLDEATERRQQILDAIKEKQQQHDAHVEQVRQQAKENGKAPGNSCSTL